MNPPSADRPAATCACTRSSSARHVGANAMSSAAFATLALMTSAWLTNSTSGSGTKLMTGRSSNSASMPVVHPGCSTISASEHPGVSAALILHVDVEGERPRSARRRDSPTDAGVRRFDRTRRPATTSISSVCRPFICLVLYAICRRFRSTCAGVTNLPARRSAVTTSTPVL